MPAPFRFDKRHCPAQAEPRHIHVNGLVLAGARAVGFVPDADVAVGADVLVECAPRRQVFGVFHLRVCDQVFGRCPADYQLRTTTITNNPSVGPAPRGFCERTETEIESKRPGCPSGWGYLIQDDQLVPAVKAKFGKADQCFNSSKKKEDVASYVAPNCIIGPNGVTGGFVLVVKDGADACERPREVQKNASLTGGTPIAVNQITPDMFVKSITAGCPGGSSLYVDLGDRSIAAVPSSSWPANAGAFCKRN